MFFSSYLFSYRNISTCEDKNSFNAITTISYSYGGACMVCVLHFSPTCTEVRKKLLQHNSTTMHEWMRSSYFVLLLMLTKVQSKLNYSSILLIQSIMESQPSHRSWWLPPSGWYLLQQCIIGLRKWEIERPFHVSEYQRQTVNQSLKSFLIT